MAILYGRVGQPQLCGSAVAVAEEGRGGNVRYLGEIDTTELAVKLAAKAWAAFAASRRCKFS